MSIFLYYNLNKERGFLIVQVLKDEIRKKILDTSEHIFFQSGFKNTTTRRIADEVGISVSNLYLYYENKEAILYGVADAFYTYIINSINALLDHDDKDKTMNDNICQFVQKMILLDQKKFVIITDKSEGTKYEGCKQQIITILFNHMKEQINKDFIQDDLILHILAKNFIEGIIEIAKNYKNQYWLENNIHILFQYHIKGIEQYM